MNELDQLRAEAEQLKNAIRVRLSGHNHDPDFLEKEIISFPQILLSREKLRPKKFEQCCKNSILDLVQVNLCQNLLFLHQITHNMTKDCSLIYQFSTWKLQAQNTGRTCCVHKLFWMSKQKQKTICAHNMFWAWNFHVLNWQFNEQSFVILWVIWCKNKCFWQRFTCTYVQFGPISRNLPNFN